MLRFLRISAYILPCVCLCEMAKADARSENYIQDALHQISNETANTELVAWKQNFRTSVSSIVDFDLMARFSIGRYARALSQVEFEKYKSVYREYSLATFGHYFEKYGDFSFRIENSIDRNERDSVVSSRVIMKNGKDVDLKWRVLCLDGQHKVVDIAIELDGSQLWLAMEQRSQFLAIIEKKNGEVEGLIQLLEEKTNELRN